MTFYLQTYPYRRVARRWSENREQTLGINIREQDDAYVLSALVPGLKSDELNIQVLEDVLRIQGEYKQSGPADKADENYLVRELPNGSFTADLAPAGRHRRGSCRSEHYRWSLNAETAQGRIRSTEADQDQVQLRSEPFKR